MMEMCEGHMLIYVRDQVKLYSMRGYSGQSHGDRLSSQSMYWYMLK